MNASTLAALLSISAQLLTLIESIRTQTPTNAPDVWAQVSADYAAALAEWQRAATLQANTQHAPP